MRDAACSTLRGGANCMEERSDEYLCTGGASRVSKQAGAYRVDCSFGTCLDTVYSLHFAVQLLINLKRNLEQVANLLCAQVNSASYLRRTGNE